MFLCQFNYRPILYFWKVKACKSSCLWKQSKSRLDSPLEIKVIQKKISRCLKKSFPKSQENSWCSCKIHQNNQNIVILPTLKAVEYFHYADMPTDISRTVVIHIHFAFRFIDELPICVCGEAFWKNLLQCSFSLIYFNMLYATFLQLLYSTSLEIPVN